MSALEECLAQKGRLTARMKEYQARLARADSRERGTLKVKISACRAAIRDVQVQIDHLDPPRERKARKLQRKRLDVGALSWDFFERSGAVWSDLEGHSWNQVEAGDTVELGTGLEQMRTWLAEGSRRLTERQRLYLDAYYNRGLSLEMIARAYGVDKSTASRVVKNGLDRMGEWVEAKKLAASCAGGRGCFDWVRYLAEVPVLTHRQRQLALLVLSRLPKTQGELAGKLELEQSTVSRTLSRAGRTLRRLDARGTPTSRPKISGWDRAGKFSLALQTGMPLYFYYRYCCKERVGGLTRYRYELKRRMDAGRTPRETAEELGIREKTVRSAWSSIRRMERAGT